MKGHLAELGFEGVNFHLKKDLFYYVENYVNLFISVWYLFT